jgi:hypothetical protein
MERFDPSSYIEDSQKITRIFGYWPTFHDAWIHELRLFAADGKPWLPGSISPVLEMVVHVFEMTNEVNEEGYFVLVKHTLAHFQFRNVEGLKLDDFSYQNAIFELIFGIEPMSYRHGGGPVEGPPPNVLTVTIDSSCGLSGEFKCQSAAVISAEPCDENGQLIGRSS